MPSHLAVQGLRTLGENAKLGAIGWAMEQVAAGKEGTNLYVLAGMTGADYEADAMRCFDAALSEVGLSNLSGEQAVRAYAGEICREILDGKISVEEGHSALYHVCWKSGYAPEFRIWCDLEDSLGLIGDGYGPVLGPPDLTEENYPEIVRREARRFLESYGER